jgi:hypothetical protein
MPRRTRTFELLHPEVWPALELLVEPVTRGGPKSALRWTCKSTQILSTELLSQGIEISDRTVAKLLRDHGYSLAHLVRGSSVVRAHTRLREPRLRGFLPNSAILE